jgi:beta-galactosidase
VARQEGVRQFEGVYMNAEVWLNERTSGHPFRPASGDLSVSCASAGKHAQVQVDNAASPAAGIPAPDLPSVWLISRAAAPGAWGVYVTTPEVTAQAASVRVQTNLENESQAARK